MDAALTNEQAASLRETIDHSTSGPSPEIPGLLYRAIDGDGNVLFEHASGRRSLESSEAMTIDTVFYLASFTKLITSIACMQLVESGKVLLDDASQTVRILPELRDVKVLERRADGGFDLVPKNRDITLRMLMTHTGKHLYRIPGFGYAFEDFKLRDWARPLGLEDFSGIASDVLGRPLVNQPGSAWQYGTSMDWAGVLIERVSGQSLEAYFRGKIFEPAAIKNISFFPGKDMRSRLACMHQRDKDGRLRVRNHLYRRPLVQPDIFDGRPYCMAGAGCFGSPIEWSNLLAVLLNDGVSPHTQKRLLKVGTVQEMFRDQIPTLPRACDEEWPSADPFLANGTPLTPVPPGTTEGWGLSFSLSHVKSATGRAPGTASWEGMANLFWFVDRENNIAVMIASQILPYGDLKVLEVMERVETKIYTALASRRSAQR